MFPKINEYNSLYWKIKIKNILKKMLYLVIFLYYV